MTTPINTATTSTSTNIIDPMGLEKAMKLLEESLEKMQNTEQQMPQLIANLAGSVGWRVYGSQSIPKGTVFVGMDEGKGAGLFQVPTPKPELSPE